MKSTFLLNPMEIRQHFPVLTEPKLLEAIVKVGVPMHLGAGEVLIDYGGYVKMMPLVLSGSIKVLREDEEGNELFLYYLRHSDVCSMSFSCCMTNKQSVIKAVVEEEQTTIIGIPVKEVNEWLGQYASWRNYILSAFDQRMYELVKVIDDIAFSNMDNRLMNYLKKRAEALQSSIITATHQEIAYDLNTSREVISRLLKKLEKMDKVKLSRNAISLSTFK
jgi:CRP/FNR family transcriptional regulator